MVWLLSKVIGFQLMNTPTLSQQIEDVQLHTTKGLARFQEEHRIIKVPTCGTRQALEIHELEIM